MSPFARALRIVIAHEDSDIARQLALLAQSLDCDPITVLTAASAIAAAVLMQPDVIVLSLSLGRHAFDLARELRARMRPRGVRIFGWSRVFSVLPGCAFDACIRAPVTIGELGTALGLESRRAE